MQSFSQRGYDRLAPFYQAIEWLVYGQRLQQARIALLDELPAWRRMLILGEGDGRLLSQICARLTCGDQNTLAPAEYKILSVDQSQNMLRRQKSRLHALPTVDCVEYLQCDARGYFPPAESYDVLVTPFFLDCFSPSELETCLPGWLAGLRRGGTLYHVDFVLPASGWPHQRGRFLIALMHMFFRWQTGLPNKRLVDPQPLFTQHGLSKVAERAAMGGMIVTQLWKRSAVVSPGLQIPQSSSLQSMGTV